MTDFIVTDPSGSKYKVTAPEGKSEQDAIKYVQDNHDSLKALPAPATAPESKGPLSAFAPMKDVFKNIWADAKRGLNTIGEATEQAGGITKPYSLMAGPKALLGAAEVAGSPAAGAAKSIADVARNLIPQDTMFGRMAGNAVEQATAMFGPGLAGELTQSLAVMSRSDSPVRALMDGGVILTLGQMSGSIARRMEEAVKSVPILGSFIRQAEIRTLDSYGVATVNKALEPIGAKVDAKTSREAITQGEELKNRAYAAVLGKIPALHYDEALDDALTKIKEGAAEMPPGHLARLNAVLDYRVYRRFGELMTVDGQTFKRVESELTNIGSRAKQSIDGAERQFGYAIDDVRGALREALGRQYPMLRDELSAVNRAFARFADVERAAGASAVSEARFTPGQLLTAVKRSDKSARDIQFLKGDRDLQKWGEAGQKVIGNKLPDSGTTERALWDVAGGGGLYALDPSILAKVGVASSLYTKPGQALTNMIPGATRGVGGMLAATGPAAGLSEMMSK